MNQSTLTIGILECGSNLEQWLDEHGDFAQWFVTLLSKAARQPLLFNVFQAHKDNLPDSADEADVWLVTGSLIGVYDEPDWQIRLVEFLQNARQTKPIVGVCYGHQLLHHMMGGSVEKTPTWGIGVHTYDVIEFPAWLGTTGRSQQFSLLASHQDQVTHTAPDTQLLATSTFCPNAITQIGSNILTVQPHPELTKALARNVYEFRREEQGQDVTDRAMLSTTMPVNDEVFSEWVFDFIDHARANPP